MEEMTMKDTIENTEVIQSPETTEPVEVPETMEVSETAEVSDTLESSETSQEEADKKPGKKKEKTAEKIIAQRTRPLKLLAANLKGMVLFQVLYRIVTMLIFFPVLIYVERALLVVNNSSTLTQANAIKAMMNPMTWMVLIVMWFLMSVFISIEQFGTYSILHASFTGQKNITAREAFDNAVDILVRNMKTSFFLLMLYILFLYPFSDLLNTSSITRFFTMPGFITEHFEKYPLIGAGYNLLTLVLGMGALRLAFVMPAMVTEKLDFKNAAKRSWQLNKFKSRVKLMLALISYVALLSIAAVIVSILIGVIMLLGVLWLEPGVDPDVILNDTTLSVVVMVLFMVFGWFAQPMVCSVCASRYYRAVLKEGFEPEPYNIENKHILQQRWPRIVWAVFCVICMYFSIPNRYQQFKWIIKGDTQGVMIMAHRGYSGVAPENTIPAFEAAYDAGATAVELDVQMTKDGKIVVLHDDNVKRTTGVDANIWEVTYDEIKNLDNGSFFSAEFAGTRIPTLEEVLQYARGKLYLNIEIKRNGHDDGIEDKVVEIIRKNEFQNYCDITSMDYDTLAYIHSKYPDILLAYTSTVGIGDLQSLDDVQIISIQETFATYDNVKALHLAGKKVFVWTVNESSTMERLVGLNVDAILTNNVEAASEVMANHHGISDFLKRLDQILYYFS